jgi:hypothetical protein
MNQVKGKKYKKREKDLKSQKDPKRRKKAIKRMQNSRTKDTISFFSNVKSKFDALLAWENVTLNVIILGLAIPLLFIIVLAMGNYLLLGSGKPQNQEVNKTVDSLVEEDGKNGANNSSENVDNTETDSDIDNKDESEDNDQDKNPTNQSQPSQKKIEFTQQEQSDGVKYTSEYLELTLPKNWDVKAKYSINADMDEDGHTGVITEITIINTKEKTVILNYVSGFGITTTIPFYFGSESDINLSNAKDIYYSAYSLQEDLHAVRKATYEEADCAQKDQFVYCRVSKKDYVDYSGVRIVILDGGIVTLSKEHQGDKDTWIWGDGVDWQFNDQYYYSSWEGDWDKSDLQQLVEVLESMDFN